MHVFVTGASGFVGSAVVRELVGAGHRVVGLVRSDTGAATVAAAGAEPLFGDLADLEGLARAALAADGVVHTGFDHDFSKFAENCEADRRVIAALGGALAGSSRPLVVTSGTGILPGGAVSTEATVPAADAATPRVATEQAVAALREQGVTAALLRLPASVHGAGDHGFVPLLIDLARRTGVAAHVGDGANRWPAVHRLDAARLYRLVLERGDAGTWHAIAEEGIAFRDIAASIGRNLGLPVEARTGEAAAAHFGWFTHFAGLDIPSSSARTRELTGWRPSGPTLLDDLDAAGYFAG